MKVIFYSLFRALCAIAVGALLIQYREQMVTWMTMLIGGLFFLSGLTAVIMSLARRKMTNSLRPKAEEEETQNDSSEQTIQKKAKADYSGGAIFAGVGSMLLGAALVFMPETFVHFLVYILSAVLILGALQQFFTLGIARNYGSVGFGWWIMPVLLLVAGCVALFKPSLIASFPLLFIGCGMIIYGVVECVNAFKVRSCRKQAEALQGLPNGKPDFSNAEVVDFEEVKN